MEFQRPIRWPIQQDWSWLYPFLLQAVEFPLFGVLVCNICLTVQQPKEDRTKAVADAKNRSCCAVVLFDVLFLLVASFFYHNRYLVAVVDVVSE
jgi:hypothetical protein